jgi:hypothetical protein
MIEYKTNNYFSKKKLLDYKELISNLVLNRSLLFQTSHSVSLILIYVLLHILIIHCNGIYPPNLDIERICIYLKFGCIKLNIIFV